MGIPDHTLLQPIGRGSYGDVWMARTTLGALRAVKIVYRSRFDSDRPYEREFSGIKRFEPISRSHDNLVDILHVGRNDDLGLFYYVMELADDISAAPGAVTGAVASTSAKLNKNYSPRTLAKEMTARGRISVEECLPVFLNLTSGLAFLHRKGLLHRDVKPANIIFVNGIAKLADIGLVTEAGHSATYVGTEGFIPPEGSGTIHADIYALAKTFYEASTGCDRLDFPSLPIERGKAGENKSLFELNAILLKACDRDPTQRYKTADEMHAELALLQSGRSVQHLRHVEYRLRVARQVGMVSLAVIILVTVGFVLASWQARVERELRADAQNARKDAETKLIESLVATAKAERRSGLSGARWVSIDAVTKAAGLARNSTNFDRLIADLRSELITAMALPDFREVRRWSQPVVPWARYYAYCLDQEMRRQARVESNGRVSLIDVDADRPIASVSLADDRINGVDGFSPDGQNLVVRRWQNGDRVVIRVADCKEIGRYSGAGIWSPISMSSDNHIFAYGKADGSIAIHSYTTGFSADWKIVGWPINMVAFSPDGGLIAGGGLTNEIAIVDTSSGQTQKSLKVPEEIAYSIDWIDSRRLLVAAASGAVYEFNLDSTNAAPRPLKGHQAETVAVASQPAGRFAISSSWDHSTRLWELGCDRLRATQRGWGRYCRFSRDGSRFTLSHGDFQGMILYEFIEPSSCRRISEPSETGDRKAPLSVSYSPDGQWLLVPGTETVKILSTADGSELASVPGRRYGGFEGDGGGFVVNCRDDITRWPIHQTTPSLFTIGPPERWLQDGINWVASNEKGLTALTRWHSTWMFLDHGKTVRAIQGPDIPALGYMALSKDGRWAAAQVPVSENFDHVQIWDLSAGGKPFRSFPCKLPFGYSLSHDGQRFCANTDESLKVWNVLGGKLELEVKWPSLQPGQRRTEWSPDGRIIATTLNTYTLGLFDSHTGELLTRLEDPDPQLIEWLEFSPDGGQLAVACSTHMVQLWDLRAIRAELAAKGLDWNHPPLPPAAPASPAGARYKFEIVER